MMPLLFMFPIQRSHCYGSHVVQIIDKRISTEPKELFLIYLKLQAVEEILLISIEWPGKKLRKGAAEALGHLQKGRF